MARNNQRNKKSISLEPEDRTTMKRETKLHTYNMPQARQRKILNRPMKKLSQRFLFNRFCLPLVNADWGEEYIRERLSKSRRRMARIESRICRWYCCQHNGFTGTLLLRHVIDYAKTRVQTFSFTKTFTIRLASIDICSKLRL